MYQYRPILVHLCGTSIDWYWNVQCTSIVRYQYIFTFQYRTILAYQYLGPKVNTFSHILTSDKCVLQKLISIHNGRLPFHLTLCSTYTHGTYRCNCNCCVILCLYYIHLHGLSRCPYWRLPVCIRCDCTELFEENKLLEYLCEGMSTKLNYSWY